MTSQPISTPRLPPPRLQSLTGRNQRRTAEPFCPMRRTPNKHQRTILPMHSPSGFPTASSLYCYVPLFHVDASSVAPDSNECGSIIRWGGRRGEQGRLEVLCACHVGDAHAVGSNRRIIRSEQLLLWFTATVVIYRSSNTVPRENGRELFFRQLATNLSDRMAGKSGYEFWCHLEERRSPEMFPFPSEGRLVGFVVAHDSAPICLPADLGKLSARKEPSALRDVEDRAPQAPSGLRRVWNRPTAAAFAH